MDDPILIVGASAAGALTAYLVASSGRPVTIVDADVAPGHEKRTLIVTDRMRSVLGPDLADGCVRSRVERFEMFANGKLGSVELTRPDLVIERSVLVGDLLRAARAAGCEVLSGHRFLGFEGDRSVRLSGPSGEIEREFSVVVGADGASSVVARTVGIRHEQLSLLQAIVPRPADLPRGTSRVWFVPADTRYFFWMIPEGEGEVAVGLISDEPGGTRATLDRFLGAHGLQPMTYQAARVPRYRRWVPIHRVWNRRDVYLVGDAAAQVKISTVGGVVTGFRGAAAAARMICSDQAFGARSGLRWELGLHALIRRALHGFDEAAYAELLDSLSGGIRAAMAETSRDSALPMLIRSLGSSPRIGLMGARGLLRQG